MERQGSEALPEGEKPCRVIASTSAAVLTPFLLTPQHLKLEAYKKAFADVNGQVSWVAQEGGEGQWSVQACKHLVQHLVHGSDTCAWMQADWQT